MKGYYPEETEISDIKKKPVENQFKYHQGVSMKCLDFF